MSFSPPPPAAPSMGGGGGNSALLDAIRGGAQLKKATPVAAPVVGRSGLLGEIKNVHTHNTNTRQRIEHSTSITHSLSSVVLISFLCVCQRNFQLKKVEERKEEEKAKPPIAGSAAASIAAVLARRSAITGDDSDSGGDDDEWD